jgi:hypothetical protein
MFSSSKDDGLEVNTEKTNYMLLSHHQNAGQNHDIKIANRCLTIWHRSGTAVINQNLTQDSMHLLKCSTFNRQNNEKDGKF